MTQRFHKGIRAKDAKIAADKIGAKTLPLDHPFMKSVLGNYSLISFLPHTATPLVQSSSLIALFSLLHDACRFNEGEDADHGKRGADLAAHLHGKLFDATSEELALLTDACERHSLGLTKADVTIQTCWDADRLDLGRVGIRPHPKYLCTAAAKGSAVIQAAFLRRKTADYA